MGVGVEATYLQAMQRLDPAAMRRAVEFIQKFMADPTQPGLSLERVTRTRSDGVWSGRVTQDLRAIILRDGADDHLLYVDHHDAAYAWARRRRFDRHPRTKGLQVFVAAEEVELPPARLEAASTYNRPAAPPRRFEDHDDAYLLSLGVPEDWLPSIRLITDDDQLLAAAVALPQDVAARLIDLASGELVTPPAPAPAAISLDRTVVSSDGTVSPPPDWDDLERLIAAPMSVWIAFLHPTQRRLATQDFSGPAKVTGSAGTGKSVVGMHRARHLARRGHRVLLTSFVSTLCENLEQNLTLLCDPQDLARIDVRTVHQVARDLAGQAGVLPARILDDEGVRELIERFMRGVECPLGRSAMLAEWNLVVQAQGIDDWEGYRAANRAGRGTPLTAADRRVVWGVLGRVRDHLAQGRVSDWQGLCRIAREAVEAGTVTAPWDSVVVDEVQDLSAQALRLVGVLGGTGPDGLMVVGDGGQRIYAHRTSLRALGIETRGRSRVLRINYRTTEQIRRFADRILSSADDLDGDTGARDGTRSVRPGSTPTWCGFTTAEEQYDYVAVHILDWLDAGVEPSEIAVFARTKRLLEAAGERLGVAGVPVHLLEPSKEGPPQGAVQLVTFHRAKGLEFKQTVTVDASADAVPNRYAVNRAGDDQDRAEAVERERQSLYVALTRARDDMLVTWVGAPCEFLVPALGAAVEHAA
jgi:hypothetical protein